MKNSSVEKAGLPLSEAMQRLVEALSTPNGVDEAVSFIDVSARLVQAAAFGIAPKVPEPEVVDLIQLAAQLEAHANKLRGVKVS